MVKDKEEVYSSSGSSILHYAAFRGRADLLTAMRQVPQQKFRYQAEGRTPLPYEAANEGPDAALRTLQQEKMVRAQNEGPVHDIAAHVAVKVYVVKQY